MKKILILVSAVLISSLLLVGCMKTPSLDRLIPDGLGGLGGLIGQTEKTNTQDPNEPTGIPPVETGKQDSGRDPDTGPRTSYEAYIDAKAILLDRLISAFNQVPEAGMEASYSLFGFSMIDYLMWPAAIIWEDDATAKQLAGVFGALDMKFERSGSKSILTYTQDEKAATFIGEPLAGGDGYAFVASFAGQDKLRSEFVRTTYGFVGQYYHEDDDGTTTHYMLTIEGQDGTIGIQKQGGRPASLTGREGPDFPQSAPEWYRVQGNRLTGVNSEGQRLDSVFP